MMPPVLAAKTFSLSLVEMTALPSFSAASAAAS